MTLYEVEIKLYVVADDESAARRIVQFDILREDAVDIDIYHADAIDAHWSDLLPFGDNPDDQTCMEILKARGTDGT